MDGSVMEFGELVNQSLVTGHWSLVNLSLKT